MTAGHTAEARADDTARDRAQDIRKGRKYDQVLAGAQEVFMRDGFEGASVDDIAREAGVSKATLYSYFPDKRLLFLEVTSAQCCRQADEALLSIEMAHTPEHVLRDAGHRILTFMLSELGQRIFRICVAEADRFPELGRQFYQSGPMIAKRALSGYLDVARTRGEIVTDDVSLAADQFAELCKADLWPKAVFGLQTEFTQSERDRIVDGAVATFMARYGAK
ncbi:TetR/AcrR family transcriptional regulator [Sagittula sp.]|uniref:TetR/AcrR family transcriptional regulator n=1 Tax=Sagittula sp. TaxID=2038081 RepID=UPI003517F36D